MLRQIVERLPLRRYRDEAGRELLDLAGAPLPDPETPARVRFLPTWDATLLAHARRARMLPEGTGRWCSTRRRRIRSRPSSSTESLPGRGDTRTAARCSRRSASGRLRREQELEEEAERLGAFHSA
jgi:hypothetical protein